MKPHPRELTSSVHPSGDAVVVRVSHGYHPDTVLTPSGRPLRITFRREESSPCSERVFFADFEVVAVLPEGQDVTVELPPSDAGEYGFTCAGRRCCVGRVIVTPAAGEPAGVA